MGQTQPVKVKSSFRMIYNYGIRNRSEKKQELIEIAKKIYKSLNLFP
jgi:hypothetical protein